MTRLCVSCGKPIPKGKRSDAKKCRTNCDASARQRAYVLRHKNRSRDNWRRYFRTDKGIVTQLLRGAVDRARRCKVPFDLDRDFIEKKLAGGVCELSGLPFEKMARTESWRVHPYTPSLDRIVAERGYTKGNVRLVCFAVNRARSNYGDEVLMKIAKALALTG